jgi:hypothetical protein
VAGGDLDAFEPAVAQLRAVGLKGVLAGLESGESESSVSGCGGVCLGTG